MHQFFCKFAHRDDGSVTSDWVVLSASMIVIVGFVIAMARDGSVTLTNTAMEPLIQADLASIRLSDAPLGGANANNPPEPLAQPPD